MGYATAPPGANGRILPMRVYLADMRGWRGAVGLADTQPVG